MIEALRDKILVQEVPRQEQVTEAGIVLPTAFSTAPQTPGPPGPISPGVDTRRWVAEAVVVLAGPGQFEYGVFVPCAVKRGDRVLIHKGGATPLSIEARECLLIKEEAVLLVLERAAPAGGGGTIPSRPLSPEALTQNISATQRQETERARMIQEGVAHG